MRAHSRRRPDGSCYVAVLDGHDMVVIAHALPHYPMELAPGVGLRHPASAPPRDAPSSAPSTRARWITWLSELKPKALTKYTPTSLKVIRKTILDARETGYGATHQDVEDRRPRPRRPCPPL